MNSVRFQREQLSAFSGKWCPKSQEYADENSKILIKKLIRTHVNNV